MKRGTGAIPSSEMKIGKILVPLLKDKKEKRKLSTAIKETQTSKRISGYRKITFHNHFKIGPWKKRMKGEFRKKLIPRRILVPIALFASLSRQGLGAAKRSEKGGGDENDSVGEEVKH